MLFCKKRTAALDARERSLERRETALAERESRLRAAEDSLRLRTRSLQDREQAADQALLQRDRALAQAETALARMHQAEAVAQRCLDTRAEFNREYDALNRERQKVADQLRSSVASAKHLSLISTEYAINALVSKNPIETRLASNVRLLNALREYDQMKYEAPLRASTRIRGSSGTVYEVTLSRCTCMDYRMRKPNPCKHMYRLALDLGLLFRLTELDCPDSLRTLDLSPDQRTELRRLLRTLKKE